MAVFKSQTTKYTRDTKDIKLTLVYFVYFVVDGFLSEGIPCLNG